VVLRYYHDAPYSEIAAALEIDQESVGPLLTRARAAMRDALR
jgi:DNA-directed RNA polymerase specialized sigma24 family protein